MSETLSVRMLISRVLDESGLVDPREVAAKVAAMVPEADVHRILVDALVADVRAVMGEHRNRALSNVSAPRPNRSAKVSGIRDWWAEFCSARVHVGDSQWTTLGQCGDAELAFIESERRADAAREIARADQFAQLRKLLRKHKVRTVAELPRDAVQGATA